MPLPSPNAQAKDEEVGLQDFNPPSEMSASSEKRHPENEGRQSQQNLRPTESENNEPYSVHSSGAKKLIVLAASLAGFFSPLSASIYYPALPAIEKALNVSSSLVNLTVTTYLVCPMLGKRSAHLIS